MTQITYKSTRGGEQGVSASRAILEGLAADGGLYVPEKIPRLPQTLPELSRLSYQDLAVEILQLFLSDYTREELAACVSSAYDDKFDTPEIAPLRRADGAWFLELFHGKTIAFKDMALSLLPHLLVTAAKKCGASEKIVILTATSGDTGKAAMAGFADVPGTEIIVFYPRDGVSPVQERQMVTQKGENTHVVAIPGNFDDAQTSVKAIFTDETLRREMAENGLRFSSANSINIGRLVPQIVYYIHAYCRLLAAGEINEGEPIRVVVPTGNFGNILAAWYAKQMGLPVEKFVCASNINKVLADFFRTHTYDRRRRFFVTSSPSMDILVSSNLERLLYHAGGEDAAKTARLMEELGENGVYKIDDETAQNLQDFAAGFATDEAVASTIRRIYQQEHYVIDPHTAVGVEVCNGLFSNKKEVVTLFASTASPYKFGRSVLAAIDPDAYSELSDEEQFEALRELSGVEIPPAIRELLDSPVRHHTVCEAHEMKQLVRRILGLA